MTLAKAVANATAALVLQAKSVANSSDDQAMKNKVIGSATQCALSTSQLVACTKVKEKPHWGQCCRVFAVSGAHVPFAAFVAQVGTSSFCCQPS